MQSLNDIHMTCNDPKEFKFAKATKEVVKKDFKVDYVEME